MATSGVYTYSVTANDIITSSFEDIGVIASGQTPDAADVTVALRTLNLLAKQWQGTSDKFPGLKIWTRKRVAMFFASSQILYSIGPSSNDSRAAVRPVVTTLGATKNASATSVTVTSTTGMTAADQIGFVCSDGTLQWTTISSVDSSTGLTLPANSVGAAASGAVVFTYTSKAQRFVEIESALLRDWTNPLQPIDIPIAIFIDVQQYEAITQKYANGDPTAILVEPFTLNTVVNTNFQPINFYKTLWLTVLYPAEDYSSTSNDIAFPQEYYAALEWELAKRLAPKFGRSWTPDMQNMWQSAVANGVNINPQETHLCFEPGREMTDSGSPFTKP